MTVETDDLERRVAALRLVLVETLAHVGLKDAEVLAHMGKLFSQPQADPNLRPDTMEYAAALVAEAAKVAAKHA